MKNWILAAIFGPPYYSELLFWETVSKVCGWLLQ